MNLESLAKIGKGTKRKNREINLLDLAEEIKSIYKNINSLTGVAKIIKLSPEMVRQFLKITDLELGVKKLIKNGYIKSVDIGYRISNLNGNDQLILAKNVIDSKLSSSDVREIVKFKKQNQKMSIEKVIDKIIKSKNQKIYVAYLEINSELFNKITNKISKQNIEKFIKSIIFTNVPSEYINYLELDGRILVIKVSKEGLKKLRDKGKSLKVHLANLADALIKEYLGDKIK